MADEGLKQVTFYEVWKKNQPYLTTLEALDDYDKYGLDYKTSRKIPDQWFIKKPKNEKYLKLFLSQMRKAYGDDHEISIKEADYTLAEQLKWKAYDGFEWGIKNDKEAFAKLRELINESHNHLIQAKFGVFLKNSKAPFNEEMNVMNFGVAKVSSGLTERFSKFDFIFFIYQEVWECMSDEEKETLLDHLLCHCRCKGEYYLVDHDVSDFRTIIDKYGMDWKDDATEKVIIYRQQQKDAERT